MAKAKKKTSKASTVKKTWFPIVAPKIFNSQIVGETPGLDSAAKIGKTVPVNLMNLTGDMRKQNISIILKIIGAKDGKLNTEVIGYEVLSSSIKRLVKRGKNKIDYAFNVITSDGNKLILKIVMITRNLTNLSSLTDLRKAAKTAFKEIVAKTTYEALISEIVNYKIQMNVKKILNKTYPLKVCEIRCMKIIGKGKVPIKKEEPKPVEEKKEAPAEEKTREEQSSSVSQKPKVSVKPEPAKEEEKAEEKPVEAPKKEEVKEKPKVEKKE